MATEITPAKIGRSMKNFDNMVGRCVSAFVIPPAWRDQLLVAGGVPSPCGATDRAGGKPLQAVEDHAVARLQAGQ